MGLQINKIKIFIKCLNVVQICILLVLIISRFFVGEEYLNKWFLIDEDFLLGLFIVVIGINLFHSVGDIKRINYFSDKVQSQKYILQNVNELNLSLRSQRHDFLNHVQIIYTLLEMEEYEEAKTYMDKLYGEIKETSKFLKTSKTAVNALIRAKSIEASNKDVIFVFDTNTKLKELKIEVWDLCKLLSNLIDNAIEATLLYPSKSYIRVRFQEGEKGLSIIIENAGYPIEMDVIEKMFVAGYTSKNTHGREHGMGLYIVKQIVKKYSGDIKVSCDNYITTIVVSLPI